jgi:hypothetical protein
VRRASLALAVALVAARPGPSQDDFKLEPGFTLLFNGKNLDGWKEAGGQRAALDGKTEAFGGRFKVAEGRLVYDPGVKVARTTPLKPDAPATPFRLRAEFGDLEIKNLRVKE